MSVNPYLHKTVLTDSFTPQSGPLRSRSYDLLHAPGNGELFDFYTLNKDRSAQWTHLPILSPDGTSLQGSSAGFSRTSSSVSTPCLSGVQDEFFQHPPSPCRPRRFACEFTHRSHQLPTPSGTTHVPDQNADVGSHKLLREWDNRVDGGPKLLKHDERMHGDRGVISPFPTPTRTSTSNMDSPTTSVDTSRCSALFREVSLMVGMTDLDDDPFCGFPPSSKFPSCGADHHRITPRTDSGVKLTKSPTASLKDLNHPAPPLTFASLASRPAAVARNDTIYRGSETTSTRNKQTLRGFPERQSDAKPIIRQKNSEHFGHNPPHEFLADHKSTLRSNEDIHMALHLRSRSATETLVRLPKIKETARKRPSLPPVIRPREDVTNRNPVRHTTLVVDGARLSRPPGLPHPLRSAGDPIPAATSPRHPHRRSFGAPVKSFGTDLFSQTQRLSQHPPTTPRKQPSDSKIKRLVRSARRLRQRISWWRKGAVINQT